MKKGLQVDAHSPQSWVWPVEFAGKLVTLGWHYVSMRFGAYRSVSVKCIWEIPAKGSEDVQSQAGPYAISRVDSPHEETNPFE